MRLSKEQFVVNLLGFIRIGLAAFIVRLLFDQPTRWALPSVLLMIGVACDLIDGPLARRWNVATDFGDGLDYLSDRFLLLSPLAGVAASEVGLPYWSHGHLSSRASILTVMAVLIAIMVTDTFPEGIIRDIGQGCVWWPIYGYYLGQVIANESGYVLSGILAGAIVTFVAMATCEQIKRNQEKPAIFVYYPGNPDRARRIS